MFFARRSLSSAATPAAAKGGKQVTLPIQLYGLHARYANALYSAAVKADTLTKVETDLNTVKDMLTNVPKLRTYLRNPIVKRSEKVQDLNKMTAGMSDVTRGFFTVLAENGRLSDLDGIMATFSKLMDAERGVVKAMVTSAEPLAPAQIKQLETQLTSTFLEKGQTIKLETRVEPSILAGLQVQVGDKFIDLSVVSRLNAVSKALSMQ
jgi:F-type H+-transporting ATPase subunit O